MRSAFFLLALSVGDVGKAIGKSKYEGDVAGVYIGLFLLFLVMDIAELMK